MQRKESRAVTGLRNVLVGVTACAASVCGCTSDVSGTSPLQPVQQKAPLTVPDVAAHPDDYVGHRIQVSGRLHAVPRPLEGPAGEQVERRAEEYPASLHLVNPDQPTGQFNLLDLYRRTGDGQYAPLTCLMRATSLVNCGDYQPGAIVTIEGTWIRHQVPSGRSGNAVFAWRTMYFLVPAASTFSPRVALEGTVSISRKGTYRRTGM